MSKEQSGRPLDSGSLQLERNNEDLDQITLTEAHGDHVGGKLVVGKPESGNGGHLIALSCVKPLEKENPQSTWSHGS